MSPDRMDLVEAALAAEDPATLYADLVDDWDGAYADIRQLADRLKHISEEMSNVDAAVPALVSHVKGQSDGLYMALRVLRERRPEPTS